jgi:hypothetical protein
MSSTDNTKSGGRGNRRKSGGGGDQTAWRALDKLYREWLVKQGIAVNADGLSKLSIPDRLSARAAYSDKAVKTEKGDELITLLRCTLISQTNPYTAIRESHYWAQDSTEVKAASMAFYGLSGERFCQILGQQPEQIKIVNAHVWPRSGIASLHLFGLLPEDVHKPRNVLRLHKDIERAFDSRFLTFVADSNDHFVLKVLNPDLHMRMLAGSQKRFAEIDGLPLITLTPGALPYRRLLAHHSVLTHQLARTKHWISDDLAAEEVNAAALMEHSRDQEAQNRLAKFRSFR